MTTAAADIPNVPDIRLPVADTRPTDTPWPAMSWPPPPDTRLTGTLVELTPLGDNSDDDGDLGDVGELFTALEQDIVWAHLAGRPASVSGYAQMWRDRRAEGRLPWLVRLREPVATLAAGAVVGTSSFLNVSVHDSRIEIGATAYTPPVWGSGVNADCKLALLTLAFDVLGVGRVQFVTDVRNHRSQRAIAALGAHYEGALRRYQRRADGTVRDSVLFSVIAEEWPLVRERVTERVKLATASQAP